MTDRDDDSSLPSTVGTSFAGGSNGPVIKILMGGEGGQVRRVPAHRLLKNNKPSYSLLRSLIVRYAFPDKKVLHRNCDVTTTYVDEDGDVVTVSTDEELEDALAAVVAEAGEGKKQVLKINADAKENSDTKEEDTAENASAKQEATKEQPPRAHSERKIAGGRAGKLEWDLLAVGEGDLDAESKDAAERLVRDIVGSISLGGEKEAAPSDAEPKKAVDDNKEEEKDDANAPDDIPKDEPLVFIHARHTCDGCGISPIMGVRYHATDRSDYDLCQGCFSNPCVTFVGDRKNFVTEELDRDRVMQHRWGRRFARRHAHGRRCPGSRRQIRQMRKSRRCPVGPAMQSFAEDMKKAVELKQDDSDKELQEAVLRSVQDKQNNDETAESKAKEEKKVNKVEETKDTKVEEKQEKKENDNEEDDDGKASPPSQQDPAASWRGIADSFSSAAANADDFADVLSAVASVVASEIETQADGAADAARSAGMTAADSTRSAGSDPVPNGIAAAFTAAMKASKVASSIASEVKAVIDKELEKKADAKSSNAHASGQEEVDEVPDIEGDKAKPVMATEVEGDDAQPEGVDEGVDELKAEEMKMGSNYDESNKDNESEKSEWEDVGAKDDKSEVESDDSSGSASSGIAPPVLARWSGHLEVLRQLGFTDDHKSVEALETLQAANLGVDSTDEVTVGDAVNYLLKNNEE